MKGGSITVVRRSQTADDYPLAVKRTPDVLTTSRAVRLHRTKDASRFGIYKEIIISSSRMHPRATWAYAAFFKLARDRSITRLITTIRPDAISGLIVELYTKRSCAGAISHVPLETADEKTRTCV